MSTSRFAVLVLTATPGATCFKLYHAMLTGLGVPSDCWDIPEMLDKMHYPQEIVESEEEVQKALRAAKAELAGTYRGELPIAIYVADLYRLADHPWEVYRAQVCRRVYSQPDNVILSVAEAQKTVRKRICAMS